MKLLLCIAILCLVGCGTNNKPNFNGVTFKNVGKNRCGILNDIVTSVMTKYVRGPVDGARDENGDNVVDADEAFTNWDFNQTILVLMEGVDFKPITWTNIDTCYLFQIIPEPVHERANNKPVWRTCRSFKYTVLDNKHQLVGTNKGTACRNIVTFEWVFV